MESQNHSHSDKRPRYLNLLKIRLPLPGILSVLHRATGAILFLSLPFWLAALQCSLASPEGYEWIVQTLGHPLMKLIVWGLAWAFYHHMCAGVRYILIDFDLGVELAQARASAMAAFIVSILLTLIFGAWLWL